MQALLHPPMCVGGLSEGGGSSQTKWIVGFLYWTFRFRVLDSSNYPNGMGGTRYGTNQRSPGPRIEKEKSGLATRRSRVKGIFFLFRYSFFIHQAPTLTLSSLFCGREIKVK